VEARLMKMELAASQAKVQEVIDGEIARLQKALGPMFEVRAATGWSGRNRVEFEAQVSSDRNHPEPALDDDEPEPTPAKPRLSVVPTSDKEPSP